MATISTNEPLSVAAKLSAGLRARLDRLKPTQSVRALVLLTRNGNLENRRRQSPVQRQETIRQAREHADQTLPDLDGVLARLGGTRLGEPNALGTVAVEVNPQGIYELADLAGVKAVLEDQQIGLVR